MTVHSFRELERMTANNLGDLVCLSPVILK